MGEATGDPLHHPAVAFAVRMASVDDGVALRVLEFRPRRETAAEPLVFVPGFVSAVGGWSEFLRFITPLRPVYYLESREKTSAVIAHRDGAANDFTIARLARDLVEACGQLGVDQSRLIVAGSSLGATTLLEALKHGRLRARAGFMIGPNTEFTAPWFIRVLFLLPAASYHLIKHFVLWYLKTFRVDAVREPEQMRRYRETLLNADPGRMKMTAAAAIGYTVWSDLETVGIPLAVALASTDTLHAESDIRRLIERLPNAAIIRCPSNRYMHSAALGEDFERFVAGLP